MIIIAHATVLKLQDIDDEKKAGKRQYCVENEKETMLWSKSCGKARWVNKLVNKTTNNAPLT